MAGEFLVIAAFIFIGVIVGFVIVLLKIQHDRKEPLDHTVIDNFMNQYSEGYSQGVLIDVDKGSERDGITFIPKDVDYMRRLKNKEKIEIKPQTIYVLHSKIIPLPRGMWSGERNRMIILPPNPEDFPKSLLKEPFGKILAKMTEDLNAEDTVIEIQRKKTLVEDMLLHETVGKDRVREYIKVDKSINRDIAKKVAEFKEDKRTGAHPPGSPYSP